MPYAPSGPTLAHAKAAGAAALAATAAVPHAVTAGFVHQTPASKLVFGDGAIARLPAELALLGVRRPLVLCGSHMRRSPVHAQLVAVLDGLAQPDATEVVPAHSSVALVERLAQQARRDGNDGFIALGGGSASDTAKAIALLIAEGGRLADHASRFTPPATLHMPVLHAPKLPVVAVVGTASGAEVTGSLGVRDADGAKLLFSDLRLASRLIVIDPVANLQVPAALMLSTAMNGLAHGFEGLYSTVRSPLAELVALDSIARFAEAMPAVHREPDSAVHRGALLYAAHLSGQVLLNARTCLHHAICHAIGAYTGAGHGDANSVVLPHALAFNAAAAPEALRRAGTALGAPRDAAPTEAIARLVALRDAVGAPRRLRDIGVPAEALAPIATKVMGERGLYFNPCAVTIADVRAVLDAAY